MLHTLTDSTSRINILLCKLNIIQSKISSNVRKNIARDIKTAQIINI